MSRCKTSWGKMSRGQTDKGAKRPVITMYNNKMSHFLVKYVSIAVAISPCTHFQGTGYGLKKTVTHEPFC